MAHSPAPLERWHQPRVCYGNAIAQPLIVHEEIRPTRHQVRNIQRAAKRRHTGHPAVGEFWCVLPCQRIGTGIKRRVIENQREPPYEDSSRLAGIAERESRRKLRRGRAVDTAVDIVGLR
jgi:hypothetical protein